MYDNKVVDIICFIAIAGVITLLVGTLLRGPLVSSEYNSYDVTEECEIISKDDKGVRTKHNSHIEYQYDFQYTVGNEVFEGTSSWLREDYEVGDWAPMRYDSNNPENALLEVEKTEAVAMSGTLIFVIIILTGLYLFFRN